MNPPPLTGQPAPRKTGCFKILLYLLGGLFALYIVLTVGLHLLVHFVKVHPHESVKAPGQDAFEKASKTIANNENGVAHGNSKEAEELAASLAEGLGEAYKKVYADVKPDILDGTQGKFLVFCQLHEDTCVFLVHVPNLRHFTVDAQNSIAQASYLEACLVLKAEGNTTIKHVAVATRGAVLYDTAFLGSYPAQTPAPQEHLEKLNTQAWDVPDLYPYFFTKGDAEAETPATPVATGTPAPPATPASPTPQ